MPTMLACSSADRRTLSKRTTHISPSATTDGHRALWYRGQQSGDRLGRSYLTQQQSRKQPITGPSRRLDIELELGCFIAKSNEMGQSVAVGDAKEHVFGYVLLNDWSARDIQAWEYVPLGPFNGKNFGTTISPWVVLADALEPFRSAGIENATPLQDYLKEDRTDNVFDIQLEVDLTSEFAAHDRPR